MRKRVRARGRRQPKPAGQMNKAEQAYALHLKCLLLAGEIEWFAFEPWKLRLAQKTTYTPDFVVMRPDGALECHEVKGHWEDDARVKIKVAAETYWMLKFVAITSKGGQMKVEEF
jgi:hypothetical protein